LESSFPGYAEQEKQQYPLVFSFTHLPLILLPDRTVLDLLCG